MNGKGTEIGAANKVQKIIQFIERLKAQGAAPRLNVHQVRLGALFGIKCMPKHIIF